MPKVYHSCFHCLSYVFYHTCRYSYITYIRHCSFIKEFSLSPIFFRHACHFLYRTTVTKLMVCMRSDVPASCASAESSTPRRPRKVARPSSGPNLHILSAFFFYLINMLLNNVYTLHTRIYFIDAIWFGYFFQDWYSGFCLLLWVFDFIYDLSWQFDGMLTLTHSVGI